VAGEEKPAWLGMGKIALTRNILAGRIPQVISEVNQDTLFAGEYE
jgi:hypothetical protein